ncbi:allergen Bos d 2-like [Capricornis sumatraensis]|uniref:allergen Bos d 2-like n=1 Tax=Capricornis sumatraensis TaxID=34865 RepID=UPI003604F656
MNVLLLSLVLVLVCAAQETPAETDPSKVTGEWRTIYSAADNKEKIVEGGPLRCYNRKIKCIDDCEHLFISFYVKLDGRCQFFSGVLERQEGGVYFIEFAGANYLQIIHVSDNILVFYFKNDDGEKITNVTEGCAKGTSFTQEEFQKYQQLNTERGIPNENIEHVIETATEPVRRSLGAAVSEPVRRSLGAAAARPVCWIPGATASEPVHQSLGAAARGPVRRSPGAAASEPMRRGLGAATAGPVRRGLGATASEPVHPGLGATAAGPTSCAY